MPGKASKPSASSSSAKSKAKPPASKPATGAKHSAHADKSKGMGTGAKVAVGVAAGAAIVGAAAAALAATEGGRKLVKKAAGAAHDLASDAGKALKAGEKNVMNKLHNATLAGSGAKQSSQSSSAERKPSKPVMLASGSRGAVGGFSLGGGSLGGSSLGAGGGMSSGSMGAARATTPINTPDPRNAPKANTRTGQSEAARIAVRGHSGHR